MVVRPHANRQTGSSYSAGWRSERDKDSSGREERREHAMWAKVLRKEIGEICKQWRSRWWLAGAGTKGCGPERAWNRLLTMRS